MTTEIDDVPNFDITVKKESLVDDMFEIYSHLFKDKAISKDQLSFEELCGMLETETLAKTLSLDEKIFVTKKFF